MVCCCVFCYVVCRCAFSTANECVVCDLQCDVVCVFVVLACSYNVLAWFAFGLLCDVLWLAFVLCCG